MSSRTDVVAARELAPDRWDEGLVTVTAADPCTDDALAAGRVVRSQMQRRAAGGPGPTPAALQLAQLAFLVPMRIGDAASVHLTPRLEAAYALMHVHTADSATDDLVIPAFSSWLDAHAFRPDDMRVACIPPHDVARACAPMGVVLLIDPRHDAPDSGLLVRLSTP